MTFSSLSHLFLDEPDPGGGQAQVLDIIRSIAKARHMTVVLCAIQVYAL
jgi:hypothetical protein